MKSSLPMPVVAVVIVLMIAVVAVVLYKGATGGVQGDGQRRIEAAPPMPNASKQHMMQSMMPHQPNGQ